MEEILHLSILLSIFSFGQDVQVIIGKIESNQSKIVDLEAEVDIETSFQGKSEPLVQTIRIWQSKDERENPLIRIDMIMPTEKDGKERVIMVMTGDSIFTKRGAIKTQVPKSKLQMNDQFQMTDVKFFKNMKEIKILRQDGNISVLELIPEETEGMKIFDKAEITVDTEKGVITNQKLFTPMGAIGTEMAYGSIGEGEKKIWVLKEMQTVTQYGMTTMKYKNTKVNKGIRKELFKL